MSRHTHKNKHLKICVFAKRTNVHDFSDQVECFYMQVSSIFLVQYEFKQAKSREVPKENKTIGRKSSPPQNPKSTINFKDERVTVYRSEARKILERKNNDGANLREESSTNPQIFSI